MVTLFVFAIHTVAPCRCLTDHLFPPQPWPRGWISSNPLLIRGDKTVVVTTVDTRRLGANCVFRRHLPRGVACIQDTFLTPYANTKSGYLRAQEDQLRNNEKQKGRARRLLAFPHRAQQTTTAYPPTPWPYVSLHENKNDVGTGGPEALSRH